LKDGGMSLKNTAVLIMDYQTDIVTRFSQGADKLLENVNLVSKSAREKGALIIYVVVQFRSGYPEISQSNKSFGSIKQSQSFTADSPGAQIHSKLAVQPSDVVVTKRRVSAFAGSDLEIVLRAQKITSLVLLGIATSGVVLSTLREAADRDFECTVLSDLCSDMDAEVHRVLTEKVFPRQASVMTAKQFLDTLGH
jgi:nicotinamidase-related amidase